jgi:hypothetical protein
LDAYNFLFCTWTLVGQIYNSLTTISGLTFMHFFKPKCLMKEFRFRTIIFSFPFMLMKILHMNIFILPSFPHIASNHENLVAHLSW